MQERVEETGRAVVHATWGQWLTPVLLDPGLRTLLGRDWSRYRQHPAAAGRMSLAVSRAVVKYTAAAALQVPADRLDLAYLPGGRPVLRGLGADLEVSLTHTGELIVVGVSRSGPIGVDAEPVGRRISFEALREHVCTAEEGELLAALPETECTERFLRLWTLKEAYTKALGHGMRRRFSAVGFAWDATGGARLVGDADGEWTFTTHLVQGRFFVSEAHCRSTAPRYGPQTSAPTPASASVPTPAAASPASASVSTPAAASPASASVSTPASAPAPASGSMSASASASGAASASARGRESSPVSDVTIIDFPGRRSPRRQ
ncbi:4'-phosphopantetheinyl transferase family protein [Streptomyces sp. NPDC054842]